jgi:hypothetical protein
MKKKLFCAMVLLIALTGCGSMSVPTTGAVANQPDPTILLVPVEVTNPALASGCWVQLYSQRNFQGDMATVVGPAEIQSMDKGTARELKREIDSLSVGPKAMLEVYEHAMFKDRVVTFPANSRVPGLITRLGFGGRIEALRLRCSS